MFYIFSCALVAINNFYVNVVNFLKLVFKMKVHFHWVVHSSIHLIHLHGMTIHRVLPIAGAVNIEFISTTIFHRKLTRPRNLHWKTKLPTELCRMVSEINCIVPDLFYVYTYELYILLSICRFLRFVVV